MDDNIVNLKDDINSQAVPKETASIQNTGTGDIDPESELPVSSDFQAQETQVPQQVIAPPKEKKARKRFKIKCNKFTCLLGSCFGCLGLIIAIVLVGIFAAPTLSNMLNKLINAGVVVPELSDMQVEAVLEKIDTVATDIDKRKLVLSEEEFNVLLAKRIEESDVPSSLDMRMNFEKDKATIYVQFSEWMPWIVIELNGDESGVITTESVKMGSWDVTEFFQDSISSQFSDTAEDSSSGEISMVDLLANLAFGDEYADLIVSGIFFKTSEIEIVIGTSVEINEEVMDLGM